MRRNSVIALLLTIFLVSVIASAQSPSLKKDIPTIAKSASGAVVTIVMANEDTPIARGTGFVVRPDGTIVTNYHVIVTGNVAVVKFADGTIFPVDGVLATDKFHDLAILKIHGKTFQALTLGNSDQIQVGEEVVAIGNPLGLELTVSNGIVSGIRTDEKEEGKLLQITAPISRGSSGGPLFNMSGEVVGINALFLEGGESLNFAIPVNDAKNLLQSQSAVLQQLPNEPEADTPKPDPQPPSGTSTEPRSDPASPREKDFDIAQPSHKTAKGDEPPPYYVRSYEHGVYIIEYRGRQLAARCRETLRWVDGPDKLGRQYTEHECDYLNRIYPNHSVGTHIRAEQMWRGDKELRFHPWGLVDRADVLDIIAEAAIGSSIRLPSPKISPEILNTLHWIQNTLADRDGDTVYALEDGEHQRRENRLPDLNGCQVTFVYATTSDWKETYHIREQVNLGDLDPTSLEVDAAGDDILGLVSLVTVHTTNKVPAVRLTVNDRNLEPDPTAPSTDLLWELGAPYASRFANALRQAITLCGGNRSSF